MQGNATANNRMELMAAIVALESLKRPVKARLHTDSQYVMKGIAAAGGRPTRSR